MNGVSVNLSRVLRIPVIWRLCHKNASIYDVNGTFLVKYVFYCAR